MMRNLLFFKNDANSLFYYFSFPYLSFIFGFSICSESFFERKKSWSVHPEQNGREPSISENWELSYTSTFINLNIKKRRIVEVIHLPIKYTHTHIRNQTSQNVEITKNKEQKKKKKKSINKFLIPLFYTFFFCPPHSVVRSWNYSLTYHHHMYLPCRSFWFCSSFFPFFRFLFFRFSFSFMRMMWFILQTLLS